MSKCCHVPSPTESVQTGNHEQSSIRPESFDVGKMWQSHNPHQPTHAVQSRALTSVTHEALPSSRHVPLNLGAD